jgi:hypothetical protein
MKLRSHMIWLACFVALFCFASSAHAQDYRARCGADSGNICFTGGDLYLNAGTTLATAAARLTMLSDGNLALYDETGRARWGSGTYDFPGAAAVFLRDGTLAVYWQDRTLFTTNTSGSGAYLTLQRDGNLVIYDYNNTPIWSAFPIR